MAKTNGYRAEQFINVIPGTGGIISTIAERVGCAWHTAKKYIEKYPTVKQAYLNERHKVDDKAVSNVYKAIAQGDLETSKWWVKMKLGDEFHETQRNIVVIDWDAETDNS